MTDGRNDGLKVPPFLGAVLKRTSMRKRFVFLTAAAPVLASLTGFGCNAAPRKPAENYQTVAKDPRRDADTARYQSARGADLLDKGDYDGAEAALKAALSADDNCSPAHNNLGKVYFHRRQLYLAAWEFHLAMRLMPTKLEPANNLGLALEVAGKLDDAADAYGKAAALDPDNVQVLGNLARARVRRGDRDPEVRTLLGKLVLRETRPDWLAWEKSTLARLEARPAD